jgi:hypothetical protein
MSFYFNRGRSQPVSREPVTPELSGPIDPDALYRADEAKSRLGWGKEAFASARKRGLKTHRCGKRVYVTGADLIAFITKEGGAL